MAPAATKRRRIEDEVKPKKKVKKVKRQSAYHSSSEDEDDLELPNVQVASDAPRSLNVRVASDAPRPSSGSNSLPVATSKTTSGNLKKSKVPPKSILKDKLQTTKSEPDQNGADQDAEDVVLGADELAVNTALNGGVSLAADSEDDDEQEDEQNIDEDEDEEDDDDDEDLDDDDDVDLASVSDTSLTSSQAARARKKRNDPSAFATSMSKILDTKLTNAKRADPVLSRSRSAAEANRELADAKLEHKARAQIRAEKRAAAEKGRVRDVLGLEAAEVDTGALMEEEKRLKKMAQRGVVKLFNAVRAAQVKAEEAMRQARSEGVVGMQKREERVNEMSKQGFLDLISSGGKKTAAMA